MPSHPDRARRHYITVDVTPLVRDYATMTRHSITEIAIMDIARSDHAIVQAAEMAARQVKAVVLDAMLKRRQR